MSAHVISAVDKFGRCRCTEDMGLDRQQCLDGGFRWENPDFHFDDIFGAFGRWVLDPVGLLSDRTNQPWLSHPVLVCSLFFVWTADDWARVLHACLNAPVNVDDAPSAAASKGFVVVLCESAPLLNLSCSIAPRLWGTTRSTGSCASIVSESFAHCPLQTSSRSSSWQSSCSRGCSSPAWSTCSHSPVGARPRPRSVRTTFGIQTLQTFHRFCLYTVAVVCHHL